MATKDVKKLTEDILIDSLDEKPPADKVKQREQAGRKFDYLEGWYVKKKANDIFGPMNWEHKVHPEEMKNINLTTVKKDGRELRHGLFYCPVTVKVTYGDKTKETTEVGVTEYIGEYNIETAIKGCVTDGMKRAFTSLGNAFGLNLYDGDSKSETGADNENAPLCEKHNVKMVLKSGSKGDFWGCPNYPDCRVTYDVSQVSKKGEVSPRRNKTEEPSSGPSVDEVKGKEEEEIDLDELPF